MNIGTTRNLVKSGLSIDLQAAARLSVRVGLVDEQHLATVLLPVLTVAERNPAAVASVEPMMVAGLQKELIGIEVVARGLVAKPALNGQLGTVESCCANGRFGVRFDEGVADEPVALKPMNLVGAAAVGKTGLPPPTEEEDRLHARWEALESRVCAEGAADVLACDASRFAQLEANAAEAKALLLLSWGVDEARELVGAINRCKATWGRAPPTCHAVFYGRKWWNYAQKAQVQLAEAYESEERQQFESAQPLYITMAALARAANGATWQQPGAADVTTHNLELCRKRIARVARGDSPWIPTSRDKA